jgi:GalNAc-alpha-(1->4)-GalNAc-alpha-(1->3)-diNAcBac-PP-undecaprenol alpha-1,4-N-acetyl-D-galactosaminyltransferase
MNKKIIALLIPDLAAGGAERVMSILANEFSMQEDIQVHLILYVKPDIFYKLNKNIIIHKLDFNYKKLPRFLYIARISLFLRKKLKEIKPDALLSFGGKYNSLVLLSAWGLGIRGYISDRSRPGIKYGFIPDLFNPYAYKLAHGIIVQTSAAKEYAVVKTKHRNIKLIPNPVPSIKKHDFQRENIILNVGRFITTKNQEELVKIFIDINPKDWKLIFIGEGPKLSHCKEIVENTGFTDKIEFIGNTPDVQAYYQRSKIFAFTSSSEGFPNVLAEAMAAGCASISYDCMAGPSDIIDDGKNGFLVDEGNIERYKVKLEFLLSNDDVIRKFSKEGIKKMEEFETTKISDAFLKIILK